MVDRRTQLLDAAITLVGTGGIRMLTHRKVDAAAELPAGSTANYFSTRDSLYDAMVARLVERERANFESIAREAFPATPTELARVLGRFARESAGQQRALTLTRYAILVESAHRPSPLADTLRTAGAGVNTWSAGWLRIVGSVRPEHDTQIIGNFVTGLVLHQLAYPKPDFDPTAQLVGLIDSLLIGERS